METQATDTNPHSLLFELVPRFHHGLPEYWGGKPPAPEGKDDLVNDVLEIWRDQCSSSGGFLLHIDGNKENFCITNLKYLDLTVALRHASDWVVDWDCNLTQEQATYVRKHNRYFAGLTRVCFRSKRICGHCKAIDDKSNPLSRCSKCKQAYYCCQEHRHAHWTEHKEACKFLQDQHNGQTEEESEPLDS